MPIYEYRCTACGKELEALQKLSEAPLKTCPACHAQTLVKRVSAAGFQLKGSGWYVTDFKGGGKAPAKKDGAESATDSKADAKPSTSGEAKSESKSEAKTEGSSTKSSPGTGSPPTSS